MDPNLRVNRFRAMMLGLSGAIVNPDGGIRADFVAAKTMNAKAREAMRVAPGAARDTAKAAFETARADFIAQSELVTKTSLARATLWLQSIFDALKSEVPQPNPARPASYANDILYIITTPEFSLNGYKNNDQTEHNASAPLPELLETHIRTQAWDKLKTDFKHLYVIFTFSCCTYSRNLSTPINSVGSPLPSDSPDIATFTNRINIVTSTDWVPRTVTKLQPSPVDHVIRDSVDGEKYVLFTPEKFWTNDGKPMRSNTPLRAEEIKVEMPHVDVNGKNLALGFGTCQDVVTDNHHDVNMVILSGSGCTFARPGRPDKTHPFLLNDSYSWGESESARDLWAAGYYTFEEPAPARRSSVGTRFKATPHGNNGVDESMFKCYLHPNPSPPGPAPLGPVSLRWIFTEVYTLSARL